MRGHLVVSEASLLVMQGLLAPSATLGVLHARLALLVLPVAASALYGTLTVLLAKLVEGASREHLAWTMVCGQA